MCRAASCWFKPQHAITDSVSSYSLQWCAHVLYLHTHTHTHKYVGTFTALCTDLQTHTHTHFKPAQWINYNHSQGVCLYGALIGNDRGCGKCTHHSRLLASPHRLSWQPPITQFSLTFLSLWCGNLSFFELPFSSSLVVSDTGTCAWMHTQERRAYTRGVWSQSSYIQSYMHMLKKKRQKNRSLALHSLPWCVNAFFSQNSGKSDLFRKPFCLDDIQSSQGYASIYRFAPWWLLVLSEGNISLQPQFHVEHS